MIKQQHAIDANALFRRSRLRATASAHLTATLSRSATIVAKAGANEDGADPATLDEVATGVAAAAAGFDHGLLVLADGGKVLAFGPSLRPAGTPPGIYLSPVPFKVAVTQVAAGARGAAWWRWQALGGLPVLSHGSCECNVGAHARCHLPWAFSVPPTLPNTFPGPAGEHHSLALSASGDVFAWGSNAEGQLGAGTGAASAAPVVVAGPGSGARDAGPLQPVTAIAAGARHSLAVNSQGQCLAWGWGLHGQCGTGRSVPSVPTPTVVAALGPLKCASVAGGMGHTVVATDTGDVYAWGLNTDGQLGDGGDETALQVGAGACRPDNWWHGLRQPSRGCAPAAQQLCARCCSSPALPLSSSACTSFWL